MDARPAPQGHHIPNSERHTCGGRTLYETNKKKLIENQNMLIRKGISYGSHLTFKDADGVPPTPPDEEIELLRMIEPY